MHHLKQQLNNEQREAVEFGEGPLLVLAGAGSGKTRVVTLRIVTLIAKGVDPSQILGLTFTNKAAQEMKERINQLSNHAVLVSTFHSLGARILRESIHHLGYPKDFTIYDEEDVDKLIKLCLDELNLTDKKIEVKALRQMISRAKNALKTPETFVTSQGTSPAEEVLPSVYARYQHKLQESRATDFDDLLYLPVRLFKEHPQVLEYYQKRWPFLLIDEYQDTNAVQYELVQMLVEKSKNIFVVGDPDQSIYSWRGANINNILNFEKDYPGAKVIRLEQNYRSHTHILKAANQLIQRNANRYEKDLWSDLGAGEKVKYVPTPKEGEEARFIVQQIKYHQQQGIPLNEMVIFYRTNFQSRAFEDILLYHRIPYVIVGGVSFYQRKEIKDLLAFLRMVYSGNDLISFIRTINLPKRGIGDSTLDKLRMGAAQSNLSLLDYCSALTDGDIQAVPVKLSEKQRTGIQDYVQIIRALQQVHKTQPLSVLVQEAIERTHYMAVLSQDKETLEDRKGNLDALVAKAAEWEDEAEDKSLSKFLEELSLKTTLDEANGHEEQLSLMTIHNGKGLEFKVVFLAGMEEDLFPHANARKEEQNAYEEERRLCYVGMTRAREHLYLTNAQFRFLWGTLRPMYPSRFIREIPKEHMETIRHGGASQPPFGGFRRF